MNFSWPVLQPTVNLGWHGLCIYVSTGGNSLPSWSFRLRLRLGSSSNTRAHAVLFHISVLLSHVGERFFSLHFSWKRIKEIWFQPSQQVWIWFIQTLCLHFLLLPDLYPSVDALRLPVLSHWVMAHAPSHRRGSYTVIETSDMEGLPQRCSWPDAVLCVQFYHQRLPGSNTHQVCRRSDVY